MQYIQGSNRNQTYFITLDQVGADNPVRLMDAFIDKLDMQKLGFGNAIPKSEGRPPHAPAVLLKLFLYGYLNKIRSSRKLEKECSRNIELQWLLQNLQPYYHTIADFRKLHTAALQSICVIAAFWFPLTITMITTITWIFWLIHGIKIKHEELN
jgi:transposase